MLTDLYRRWLFELWQAGDESVAADVLAEDLVDHNRLPDQPAGRAGDLWASRIIRTAFPDARFALDVVLEQDDLVSGRWTMTGTHLGPLEFMGLPPTGRPVQMSGQEIFRVRDGLLAEVWHSEDTGALMRGLELEPPPAMLKMAARRSARRYRRST
jgi:predicted ester cyclase